MLDKFTSVRGSNYTVTPGVVLENAKSVVAISPKGERFAFTDESYKVTFIPMEHSTVTHISGINPEDFYKEYDTITVVPENGCLKIEYSFTFEQIWIIAVSRMNEDTFLVKLPVYSLKEDLYERMPYKGDFHLHSCCSDGKEEPAIVAAAFRKAGYDFIPLTDHYDYSSSLDMIDAYKDAPIDIKLFPGEEVHLREFGSYLHIVNFAASESINDYVTNNLDKCKKEIDEIVEKIQFPETVNPYECALRIWISDKIRELGGMSILAHPHWITKLEFHMRSEIVRYLMTNHKFDAMEAISGASVEENNLQTALYQDLRAEGVKVPIVGTSDTHGIYPPYLFKRGSTILFAKGELTKDSIKEAVSNLYSVAIENYNDEKPRLFGPYRLVKFVMYLMHAYFPKHNELCTEEGLAMESYFLNEEGAKERLSGLSGRTEKYRNLFMRG